MRISVNERRVVGATTENQVQVVLVRVLGKWGGVHLVRARD